MPQRVGNVLANGGLPPTVSMDTHHQTLLRDDKTQQQQQQRGQEWRQDHRPSSTDRYNLNQNHNHNQPGLSPKSQDQRSGEGSAGEQTQRLTAYERLSRDLSNDKRCLKEITLGKRIGFYRIRSELGSGNFSQVKLGIHALTKEKVAIKILDKTKLDQKTQRLLSREIASMERLHHPNITRLYEVVETLAKLHIVMEYAGGGELFNKISNEGRLPEPEAKHLFAQIVAAVQHMHENHVIHRDLKTENVFFVGIRTVKVGDFGFSTFSKADETLNTFCGSPPYAAPELFKDESYFGAYVDIWALGIMLYFMVTGIMPFRADTVAKLKKYILDGTFTIPAYVTDSCQFLIRGILRPLPKDRFSLEEIRKADWMEGEDFPEELDPYELNPSNSSSNLTGEEVEARHMLFDLGITTDHFKEAKGRDSRSSITGTYRIALHKIHKKNCGNEESLSDLQEDGTGGGGGGGGGKEKNAPNNRLEKKQSKLCVIL